MASSNFHFDARLACLGPSLAGYGTREMPVESFPGFSFDPKISSCGTWERHPPLSWDQQGERAKVCLSKRLFSDLLFSGNEPLMPCFHLSGDLDQQHEPHIRCMLVRKLTPFLEVRLHNAAKPCSQSRLPFQPMYILSNGTGCKMTARWYETASRDIAEPDQSAMSSLSRTWNRAPSAPSSCPGTSTA